MSLLVPRPRLGEFKLKVVEQSNFFEKPVGNDLFYLTKTTMLAVEALEYELHGITFDTIYVNFDGNYWDCAVSCRVASVTFGARIRGRGYKVSERSVTREIERSYNTVSVINSYKNLM